MISTSWPVVQMWKVRHAAFLPHALASAPFAHTSIFGSLSGQTPLDFIYRHSHGDWGEELCEDDRQLNDEALVDGSRLLSAYKLRTGVKIWVITEAADDGGQRVATTVLLPCEY